MVIQALTNQIALNPTAIPTGIKRQKLLNDLWLMVKKITSVAQAATYTSDTLPCKQFSKIVGTCLFDRAGTLYIDQSPDAANFDYTTTIATAISTTVAISIDVVCPFFRVRWTESNVGATAVNRLYIFGKVMS